MSLLHTVTEGAYEPEYRTTAAPRRTPWVTLLVAFLLAALLTYAMAQTFRTRDVDAAQTSALVAELDDARAHQQQLVYEATELEQEIARLQQLHLEDPGLRAQLEAAGLLSGALPVVGPGIVVVVDDADQATASEGRVLDSDLSILVNGLFAAGAEAVAVNGRRISTRTPIRSAGAAITVDYVSMDAPYRVEAIGDPRQLPARFGATRAASWWQYLRLNYGLTIEVTPAEEDLSLAADPGLGLRLAKGD